jgi:DNA-binding NtrC family response regulator
VIPVQLPTLRSRPEDIPILALHFFEKYGSLHHRKLNGIAPDAMKRILELPWKGNVRELENAIERAVILSRGPMIEVKDLLDQEKFESTQIDGLVSLSDHLPTLAELEKQYMRIVIEKTGGKKDKAARILGINRRTLYRKEQGLELPMRHS